MKVSRNKFMIYVILVFTLLFPKGGIKLGNIPVTWGYLILFAFSLLIFFLMLFKKKVRISGVSVFCWLLTIPLCIYFLLAISINGYHNLGFAMSFILSFCVFPFLFFILIGYVIKEVDTAFVFDVIRNLIFMVVIYGIFAFLYSFITGKFIEIPYLTINAGDVGLMNDKSNDRGNVHKLMSTYNNGNIYGICMLMFAPFYMIEEKNKFKKILFKISLFLTLSRTVWIGIVLNEFLHSYSIKKVSLTSIIKFILILVFSVLVVFFILHFFLDQRLEFLFDKNLGNRVGQFDVISRSSIIADKPFFTISEITYLGILEQLGGLGLLLFILSMTGPVIVFLYKKLLCRYKIDNHKKSFLNGMLIYLIISMSDGALLYIPVMAFYWFISTLIINKKSQKI